MKTTSFSAASLARRRVDWGSMVLVLAMIVPGAAPARSPVGPVRQASTMAALGSDRRMT